MASETLGKRMTWEEIKATYPHWARRMINMNKEDNEYISGGISGAITEVESEEAYLHALKRYVFYRTIDYDVDNISKNNGIDKKKIQHIKSYLFLDNILIGEDGSSSPFEPNFAIVSSWDRLAFSPDEIKPHDILLLQHELYEMSLYFQGVSQHEAHIIASKKYNYTRAASDYYANLKMKQNRVHKFTPITMEFIMSFESKFKAMVKKIIKKTEKHIKRAGR